ncbi:unnamed protein product [Rotaria socialis]|uniref:UBZ1-type domain-containing protein n=1 Tax=Rotaria socialis TaxID=392032 RepID=A0A819BD51_9BILA|nr:unnamed protein product [Rotaria socialis]
MSGSAAEECRQILIEHEDGHFIDVENKLSQLTEQLKQSREEDEFNEIDLDRFKTKLAKLAEEFRQPSNIKIEQDSISLINKISVVLSTESIRRNACIPQEETKEEQHDVVNRDTAIHSSIGDFVNEITQCPMCLWEFPKYMTMQTKTEHIENHFA